MSMDWFLFPPGSYVFLTLLALLVTLLTQLVQRRTIDYDKLNRANKIQREYLQLQNEFRRTGDRKIKKKLTRMKPTVDQARAESLSMSTRPMLYTTIPVIIIWMMLGPLFADIPVLRMPFSLSPLYNAPLLGRLFRRGGTLGTDVLGYAAYYILNSYMFSMIFQQALGPRLEMDQ